MEELKPNKQRAKNAVILIWIVLAIEIIASLFSGYLQYVLLQSVASGAEISNDVANANDTREQIIGILSMIAMFISGITIIMV